MSTEAAPSTRRRKRGRRPIGYRVEAAAAYLLYELFRVLPLDWASALGGLVGRTLGPRMGVTRRALSNLERALPEASPAERAAIVRAMWDNLGRVAAEYPHLDELSDAGPGGRIEVIGAEHLDGLIADGRPGFVVSGHLANWEVMPVFAGRYGLPLTLIYRAPNNPLTRRLLGRARRAIIGTLVPKGKGTGPTILKALRNGEHVGMLIDQKLDEGIPVPFFGRDAMTTTTFAAMALRFGCPIVPARLERTRGARFRLTVHPPILPTAEPDLDTAVPATVRRVTAMLEEWIRDRPDQWLWLHRRWPD